MAYLNKFILQLEGLAVFALSVYFYYQLQFSWGIFLVLLLAPDISALGYIKNVKVGSILYNLFHTYSIPLILMICGLLLHSDRIIMICLIWIAHIGMDRMFGLGLKYPTKFQDTHLNRI